MAFGDIGGLCAESVSVGYPAHEDVLQGVSMSIARGELVALVGPNGSGKSTLVRVLCGLLRPRTGRAMADGVELGTMTRAAIARTVALAPQDTGIAFEFTAEQVIRMGRYPYQGQRGRTRTGGDEDQKAVAAAMEMMEIDKAMAEKPVVRLSGGERQRVVVARALAQATPYLLLDEPTSSLDLAHQNSLLNVLLTISRNATGVLVVLHDINSAASFADRVVVMHGGRVVADGSPSESITRATIRDVYGASVWVRPSPLTGRPQVVGILADNDRGDLKSSLPLSDRRVMIVCGGGTGSALMVRLQALGADVTCGPLNNGDTDHEVAVLHGIDHLAEPPFTAISERSCSIALGRAGVVDLMLVTDVPFGMGNLLNLKLAVDVARSGTTIGVLSSPSEFGATRDYTRGDAAALWAELLAFSNVHVVDDLAAYALGLLGGQGSGGAIA
jgi:iron complex transport system ATP-binding protein